MFKLRGKIWPFAVNAKVELHILKLSGSKLLYWAWVSLSNPVVESSCAPVAAFYLVNASEASRINEVPVSTMPAVEERMGVGAAPP